jgi:hypothetical protein
MGGRVVMDDPNVWNWAQSGLNGIVVFSRSRWHKRRQLPAKGGGRPLRILYIHGLDVDRIAMGNTGVTPPSALRLMAVIPTAPSIHQKRASLLRRAQAALRQLRSLWAIP